MSANKTTKSNVKNHSFQAEVQQLLQLMIHSLYSNKEIFLRELISNASDACDKLRFQSLTDGALLEEDEQPLGIWVSLDEKKGTISIRDNGIGMSEQEVINDIGTIARSGTKAFLERMSQENADDSNFIGQFGVGFYSCFLVGKQVTLLTRKAGTAEDQGVKWQSDGGGEYTLEQINRPQRGTEIVISLNKDGKEYAEAFRVKSVIAKYSDHVSLPIHMVKQEQDDEDKKDKDTEIEWEAVNRGSALWVRPKKEISETEYNDFYTALTYDPEPPATVLHNRVEGSMEYISLLYIPSKAPYDLWDREQRHGIKLYVRRIFISDDAKALMPNYLRFVRGLIDSSDLPLNVSREFLQHNRQIEKIKSASIKKVLAELTKLAKKDDEKYHALWKEYGKVLKEGIVEDFENKQTIAELIRFATTHNNEQEQKVSLNDYIARMPEKQKAIYYITAENHNAAESSPHLEIFRKNDIEVLLLSDPIDEWMVGHLNEFEGKSLKSIAKGDLDIDDLKGKTDSKKTESKQTEPLIEKLKSALQEQVQDVRVSDRLVDSPSCLIADANDLGGNMERILQAIGQDAPIAKPILEINPDHALIKQINPDNEDAEDWAKLLFDQAVLAEGGALKNPSEFVKRMNRLLTH